MIIPRKSLLAFAAATVFTAGAAGVVLTRAGDSALDSAYRTEVATRGDLQVVVSATGNVRPRNQVDVGSELSGTVAEVLVEENDTIRKGHVLARIDTTKLSNAVAKARATVASAQARVAQARATTLEAGTQLARLEKVRQLSAGKVPAASEMESAQASFARARADEAAARAAVEESQAVLLSAETDLRKATIRSPIDGVVLSRAIEPGQTVAASLQAPVLFTLAEDLARMELTVDIDEADVGRIKSGQTATFTVDAWPDRKYPAALDRVSYGSSTTEGVVSYKATLTVDNADLSLRPGMTATAAIEATRHEGVLLVSNAALRFSPGATRAPAPSGSIVSKLIPRPPMQPSRRAPVQSGKGGGQQVHLLVGGQPQALAVSVGETDGRVTEIVGGDLKEGDTVIVEHVGGPA